MNALGTLRTLVSLVACTIVAPIGCIIPPFEADCPTEGGCGPCIDSSGCGWCAGTGSCVPGTSWGPEESFCPGDWHYDDCDEPSQACNDSCSFANDGDCDEGTQGIGLCDPGTDCSDCNRESGDCAGLSDCSNCTRTAGCGWCGYFSSEGLCLSGGSEGPDEGERCASQLWRFGSCSNTASMCSNYCEWANDGACDEPSLCSPGTDCNDCQSLL